MTSEAVIPCEDTGTLRGEIIAVCLFMQRLNYFIGTWGNVSVRLSEGLLITPSRMEYNVMQPEDLVVVSWKGIRIRGRRNPSSETELHRRIFMQRKDIGALVHAHAPYSTVLSCAHRSLPVCAEDMSQIIGAEVRCSRYAPGGRHQALADAAVEVIGDRAMAVLLGNHGAVAGGRTLSEAVSAVQVLEKAALVSILAPEVGGSIPIPPELVEEERYRFLYKYGSEADAAVRPGKVKHRR